MHLSLNDLDPQVLSVLEVATRFINHHAGDNYPDDEPITINNWFDDAAPGFPDPPALILDSRPLAAPGCRMVMILGDPYHSEGGPVKLTAWFEDWSSTTPTELLDSEVAPDWVVFDFDTVAQLIWTECSPHF